MPIAITDPVAGGSNVAGSPKLDETGVGETIVQVVEDGRAYAAAQVAFYKAVATARLRQGLSGIIFGAIAAVLALSALIGLIVGLILTLAAEIGTLWATLVVVGVVLVLAAILGKLAAGRLAGAFGAIE
jgi:hypothetical protein